MKLVYSVKEDEEQYCARKVHPKGFKPVLLNGLLDLKVDYAFKQLFGSEKNKEITIVFLNSILKRTGADGIKDIKFENTEMGREYEEDKLSMLDILEEGIEKGIENGISKVIMNMSKNGAFLETISQLTVIPIEQIEGLINFMS
ncbi:hypothetical protein PB01_03625 [Psychrobacillus glaciei]|uniref:Transposase n=1 Tax=Psychrobacillus glaciei TaxID=2283160 RepID=A0A5J6SJI2_9BACI|nr:PD-(D/E)XK nuclease family transposase [Psychrobacillus glaciei]QFF97978.1 hypothetical protein PB01_03625 [Psychrobacillus glaciei]